MATARASLDAKDAAVNRMLFADSTIGTPWRIWIDKSVPSRSNLVQDVERYGGLVTEDASSAILILVDPKVSVSSALNDLVSAGDRSVVLDVNWVKTCITHNMVGDKYGLKDNWGGFKVDLSALFEERINEGSSRQATSEPVSRQRTPESTSPDPNGDADYPESLVHETQTQETQEYNPFAINHNPHGSHFFPLPNTNSFPLPHSIILGGSSFPGFSVSGNLGIGTESQSLHSRTSDILVHKEGQSLLRTFAQRDTDVFGLECAEDSLQPLPLLLSPSRPLPDISIPLLPAPTHVEFDPVATVSDAVISSPTNDIPDGPNDLVQCKPHPPSKKRKRLSEDGADRPSKKKPPVEDHTEPLVNPLDTYMSASPSEATVPVSPISTPAASFQLAHRPRSPTPPVDVVDAHGGNRFTEQDVAYLHKYIQYCKDTHQMLSLKEICEHLALKAPHHTFYSWRRFCNKRRIQVGAYTKKPVARTRSLRSNGSIHLVRQVTTSSSSSSSSVPSTSSASGQAPSVLKPSIPTPTVKQDPNSHPNHNISEPQLESTLRIAPAPSPTLRSFQISSEPNEVSSTFIQTTEPRPPDIIARSTTGKGIAFTNADVNFLLRNLSYQRYQSSLRLKHNGQKDEVNMAQFWNDIAKLASHHSRQSWMKYWRRHSEDLVFDPSAVITSDEQRSDGPSQSPRPIPPAPEPLKRQRYTKEDDLLLAQYLLNHTAATNTPSSMVAAPPEHRSGSRTRNNSTSSISTQTINPGASQSLESVFRQFALVHPHHPAKGWLERFRTHKSEIEHLIAQLKQDQAAPS